jgi:hypothetical protein
MITLEGLEEEIRTLNPDRFRCGEFDRAVRRIVYAAARVGFVRGLQAAQTEPSLQGVFEERAKREFPLMFLREEPDPHGGDMDWRWLEGALQLRYGVDGVWRTASGAVAAHCEPTAERVDLWHSLRHRPFQEE